MHPPSPSFITPYTPPSTAPLGSDHRLGTCLFQQVPRRFSAVVTNKRPTVSSGNIAKPTPVQATHGSKIGGGTYIKTMPPSTSKGVGANPMSIPGSNNKPPTIPSASSSGVIPVTIPSSVWTAGSPSFPPGSSVIKQPLSTQQPRQPHHHHAHGPTVVSVHSGVPSSQAYSPLVGKQPPPHQQRANPEPMFIAHPTMQGHVIPVAAYPAMLSAAHGGAAAVPHPTSSTLTELLAPSPVVAMSSLRDGGGGGGGGKAGKVHDVAMRPYSPQHISSRHGPSGIRERSTSGDTGSSGMPSPQTRTESHTTSAQPTPNADHIDTRLERPAQPSSGPSGQLSSPLGVPSPYQGPPRERSNSTDTPSVIPIISNPGLTGRHIAAISSNQPPGYAPNNSGGTPQSLQPTHTPGANLYRSVPRSKSEYGVDPGSLPPAHPTTLHLVAGSTPQVQNASPWKHPSFSTLAAVAAAAAQSTLTATVISSSSSSSSSVNSPGGTPHHPNSLPLSAGGSPMTSLSPSRRPGIIRKRPHESWTGSPNLNKIPFGSAVSLSSPGHAPRGGDNGAHSSHPLSPPISTYSPHQAMAESLTNHVSSLDSAPPPPGDIIPSPRKKRRKQDVIPTDDQYASNVPNNIRPDVAMAMESDLASSVSPRQQVSMATRTRGRRDDSSSPREDSSKSCAPAAVDEKW
ncbi:hypothetical protein GBAR_LOCUS1456 [Geodia barretti]|uniref:Uncharacterized protein n=1 Tax=Geodia barretti TaxID=519541 RepID=A0AA35QW47_GEOBA|nr:hypothetical protein GBAR_LOCUS1456 [Geodia barretti]